MDRWKHITVGLLFVILMLVIGGATPKYEEFLFLLLFLFPGACGPDIDLFFSIGYHRNIITHSSIISIILFFTIDIYCPYFYIFYWLWASHLFADMIPNTSNLTTWKKTLFYFRAPAPVKWGKHAGISLRKTQFWLILNACITVLLSFLPPVIGWPALLSTLF